MNNPRKRIIDELINLRAENKKLNYEIEDRDNYIKNLESDKKYISKSCASYKYWNTKLKGEITSMKSIFEIDKKCMFKDFTSEINKIRCALNEYINECSALRNALRRGEHQYLFRKFKDIIKDIPDSTKNKLNSLAIYMKPLKMTELKDFDELYINPNANIEFKKMGIIDLIMENLEDE